MSDTEDALGMGQRDLNKIIDIHNKEGYKEGISDGRESEFQAGFDLGFRDGIRTGIALGQRKAIIELEGLNEVAQKLPCSNCTSGSVDGDLQEMSQTNQILAAELEKQNTLLMEHNKDTQCR